MIKFEKKSRSKDWKTATFPSVTAVGYFTGGDVEVFNPIHYKILSDQGTFGLNPRPRQIVMLNQQQQTRQFFRETNDEEEKEEHMQLETQEIHEDTLETPNTIILFLEEAFFLCKFIECLEIYDFNEQKISLEKLWHAFYRLKDNFVECLVAYVFLKSRNWMIKPGLKFGGDFRKLNLLLCLHSPSIFKKSILFF